MATYNIVASLFEMAKNQPETMAIAIPRNPGKRLPNDGSIHYKEITYKDLAEETNNISKALLKNGFVAGDRVVLMVPPGIEFITLSFAFLQSGIIPVLIDPGIGLKNLKECIEETSPVGFIGISKAHIARVLFGWGKTSIRKKVTLGPRLFWRGYKLRSIVEDLGNISSKIDCFQAEQDQLAAILFTSGSTGVPKGVMCTHGNFLNQVEIIRKSFGMQPGEVDLPTFAPFALFNPTAGVSTVIADMNPTKPAEVDPERIIRAIQQFKVTNMFGSPALIDKVGRYIEENNVKTPSIKRVLSAGAPVPAKTLNRFSLALNTETQILTPYGATEAMPITSIGSHELLRDEIQLKSSNGAGICIGKPVHNIEIKLIKISDDPIIEWNDDLEVLHGAVGEIVVKGPNVTKAYYNREKATRLAKISDGDDFWHRMGDLGYMDEEGNYWFCGRKSHRVRLKDRELYTVQCEVIFNQHPLINRTALVKVKDKAVLCVEIEKDVKNPDKNKISEELITLAGEHKLPISNILYHSSFPVDIRHNAKIFREKLAAWAEKKISV